MLKQSLDMPTLVNRHMAAESTGDHLLAKMRLSIRRFGLFSYAMVDQAGAIGATFLANIVLARFGTKEEYGLFVLVYTFFTFLCGVHNALILEPFTVFGAGQYRARFRCYFLFILRANICMSLAVATIVCIAGGVLYLISPAHAIPSVYGMAFAVATVFTVKLFKNAFYIQQDIRKAAIMSMFYFCQICSGLFMFWYFKKLSGLSIFIIIVLASAITTLIALRSLPFPVRCQSIVDLPGYWLEHWRYSKWVLLTGLVFQLVNQGYYWIVGGLVSVADLAEFRAMHNLVLPIGFAYIAASQVILPRMANAFSEGSLTYVFSMLRKMSILFTGLGLVYTVMLWKFGDNLIDLVYGGKYDKSTAILYVLSLTSITLAFGHPFNDALKAVRKPQMVFLAYLTSGGVTLFGGIPLSLRFGIAGAAWGMLASTLVYAVTLACAWFGIWSSSKRL